MAQLQQDNLFYDVQKKVCDIINSSPDLSAIGFFPANEKDLETQITASLRKQGVCGIVIVNEAEFQGFQDGMDTAWKITDLAVQIVENAIVNRASNNTGFLGTCQDIAAKVSQVLGSPEYGWHGFFNLKKYEEGEDGGLITAKVTFQASVQTNISSYVPPSAPDQKFPFATQGWVLSNFIPLSSDLSSQLSACARKSDLSNYLPLSGGHMTGGLYVDNSNGIQISSRYFPNPVNFGLAMTGPMLNLNGWSKLYIWNNTGNYTNLEVDGSDVLTENKGDDLYYAKSDGTTNRNSINAINSKIPAQATSSNQLADKNFVNSSIATETAYFRGTYNSVAELPTTGVTNNDYAFVIRTDSLGQTFYDRYKYSSQTGTWAFEYSVNNTGFTAAQYAAINSGITQTKVQVYDTHVNSTSNPHYVTKQQVGLGNVDNTSDADKPVSNAAQQALNAKVSSSDVYLKSQLSSVTLSGEYIDSTTFSFELLTKI